MRSPLYAILDSSYLPALAASRQQRLQSLARELLEAGVQILQFRNKTGAQAEIMADATTLQEAVAAGSCTLILNDDASLAAQLEFDGVHVGQEDTPAEQARLILGPQRILGVSTHNSAQLRAADSTSADYIAIGPVFATTSKQNPDPVIGLDGVRRARALTSKPLVAIGGITVENCAAVCQAGADCVAVISSLFADSSGKSPGKIASDFFAELR